MERTVIIGGGVAGLSAGIYTMLLGGKARDLFLKGIDAAAEALGSRAEQLHWADVPHYSAMASRMHGNDPQRYAQLVDWSLQHPRTVRPWTLPGAPVR